MKNGLRTLFGAAVLALAAASVGQTWTRLAATGDLPPHAGVPLLLTDGSILVHNVDTPDWYKLSPNSKGDYIHGVWKKVASMSSDYGPRYFASAVLADGRVVVTGGEYLFLQSAWTNKGAVYDPVKDQWVKLAPPAGWTGIGDAQSVVLPDGRFMLANLFDTRQAILNPTTLTWTAVTNTGKRDRFDEEGWTLMPDGTVLTVDAENAPAAEKYIISTMKWVPAGSTPQSLENPQTEEIGPAVLLPNGKVFATGATGHTATYTPGANPSDPGTWVAGPDYPLINGLEGNAADAPACLLPNGKVLVTIGHDFDPGTKFYEYNGSTLTLVPATPNSPSNPNYQGNMLMLPNGQMMYTDMSADVEIYTPTGGPQASWKPVITTVNSQLLRGQAFSISGKQFNGLSQCNCYGDDNGNASNYPIVRITNKASGNVFYCRSYGHSTMGVATGNAIVSTHAQMPANIEIGPSSVQVVANGIASDPVDVNVTLGSLTPDSIALYEGSGSTGSVTSIVNSDNVYFTVKSANVRGVGPVASAQVTYTLPSSDYLKLQVAVESNAVAGSSVTVFVWNWATSKWVMLGAGAQTTTDAALVVSGDSSPNYFNAQKKVKLLFRAIRPSTAGNQTPFTFKIDQVSLAPL